MLAIVTSYLISNCLHLILTILEHMQSKLLHNEFDSRRASTFYTMFGDSISFIYMVTSAIRIYIYILCNWRIRRDIRHSCNMMMVNIVSICQRSSTKTNNNDIISIDRVISNSDDKEMVYV
jgi:hypothetical protein